MLKLFRKVPHIRLDGGVNHHVHVLEGGLLRIHVQIVLKVGGHEITDARDFRPLFRSLDDFGRIGGQDFLPDALAVLQQEGDVSGCAYARQGRRRDHVRHAGGNLRVQLAFQPGGDAVRRHARAVRSDHGFREMKKKELEELWTELMRLNPFTVVTTSTPGSSRDDLFNPRGGGRRDVQGGVLSGSSTPPNR